MIKKPRFLEGDHVMVRSPELAIDSCMITAITFASYADSITYDVVDEGDPLYKTDRDSDQRWHHESRVFPYQEPHSDDFETMIEKLNNYTVPA